MKATPIVLCLAFLFMACELDPFLFNSKTVEHYSLPDNAIPDSLIQEVQFKSGENTLYGFWIKSSGLKPAATLLYCHGNKHSIDEYWDRIQFLHTLNINLFIFDYRGFGKSEGTSSESGLIEDGSAAWSFIRDRYGVTADSLILYGYSLGNVVSIYLASEVFDPLCLFAESPFASATALSQGALGIDLPDRWLTEGTYDNAERIKGIRTPFCLMHGEEDDFVRWKDNGKIVWENAPEPKELHLVSKAGHTDIPQTLGIPAYLDIVRECILSAAGGRP